MTPMRSGLSPGEDWLAIANGGPPAAANPPLAPEVARLVPDAVNRMVQEREDLTHHDVEVVMTPTTIEFVFLPRLAPGERLHPGGGTSLGREVHLYYDRTSGAFLRRHFAR